MPSNVRVFRVEIGEKEIQVNRGSDLQAPIKSPLSIAPLERDTIEVLVGMLRQNRLTEQREYEVLGDHLWAALFGREIGRELLEAIRDNQMVRVELVFDLSQQALASWPWEYLHCPKHNEFVDGGSGATGYFLATRTRKLILTRQIGLNVPARTLKVEQLPVRVLFVVASPQQLAAVEYEALLERLGDKDKFAGKLQVQSLISPTVDPNALRDPDTKVVATYAGFRAAVESFEPHIIHFVGHGQCVVGGGQIAFVKSDYTPDWITDEQLALDLMDFPELRLVFLQACESALPDPYQAISGMAMRLAHQNIPAIVAMQYKVQNRVANDFAEEFYQALVNSKSVYEAVQAGRKAIGATERLSFGLPVLYVRSQSDCMWPPPAWTGPAAAAVARAAPSIAPMGSADEPQHGKCPWCGANAPPQNFCPVCRQRLKCPSCSAQLRKGDENDCHNCGFPLADVLHV